jgi:hypothetical protein
MKSLQGSAMAQGNTMAPCMRSEGIEMPIAIKGEREVMARDNYLD